MAERRWHRLVITKDDVMETIIYEKEARIATITLNRPEKRNALNAAMVDELKKAFDEAEKADDVRVILLQANGPAFSAGADLAYLKQLQTNTFEENLLDSQKLKELFYRIYTHPKPVMATIEGAAIAGGCGLATVCDFTYAVPEAVFGYSEVKIGFIPALVSVFLSRKIGEGRARSYLLTGQQLPAEKALAAGLITGVLSRETIREEVRKKALELAESTSASGIGLTKQLMAQTAGMSVEEALELAARYNAEARATPDCKAGIQAFLAKEKIKW